MPRDAVSRTANVGTVGKNGLRAGGKGGSIGALFSREASASRTAKVNVCSPCKFIYEKMQRNIWRNAKKWILRNLWRICAEMPPCSDGHLLRQGQQQICGVTSHIYLRMYVYTYIYRHIYLYIDREICWHGYNEQFLKTSDCTEESRKDETCLQLKMKKHYIKT